MTARRVPPFRGPARPNKPKEKDVDSELRHARASRKADAQQKNRLRRHDWVDEDEVEVDAIEDTDIDRVAGNGDDDADAEDDDDSR